MRRVAVLAFGLCLAAGCSDSTSTPDGRTDGPRTDGLKTDGLKADGPKTDFRADILQPDLPPCVTLLPTSFPVDTVLKKDCYLAKQTPSIAAGVKITMEPGVRIVFFQNVALNFTGDQVLLASGTATDPILFTGAEKRRGLWRGVFLNGMLNTQSRLDYVTIEHAGDTTSDKTAAALRLMGNDKGGASITHTTIRESQGWGLWIEGFPAIPQFNNNTLTKNTLGPVHVGSELAGVLDATTTYKGNDRDQIVVKGQYLQKAATWAVTEVPYFIESGIRLTADWTIVPGATLIMAKTVWLDISGDAGALIAQGTSAKPILFTAELKQRGGWVGLKFDGSNNTRNVLDYATVEYCGDTVYTSDKDSSCIKLMGDSHGVQLKMSHTTLKESQGWGMWVTGSAILPSFEGNTLTKNTLGPASVSTEVVHYLLPASAYTGNDVDRLTVRDSYVSKNVTWLPLDVPYLITFAVVPNHATLTIAPGVTLLMGAKTWINVSNDDTALHAVGTAAKPIVITGATQTKGSWESIVFDNSNNGTNALDYCTIEYGGGGTAKGYKGMIIADSDSSGVKLSLTNSKVQHSAVCGLYYGFYAQVTQTGTTYADNTGGDACKQP